MSSSLDDREPYEFFQEELDQSLFEYKKQYMPSVIHMHTLNKFIEFICFVKALSKSEEITKEIIENEFIEYLQTFHKDAYEPKEAVKSVGLFLKFME